MRIEIEDGTIEDLIREALDGVDILENVDVEELVANELENVKLLEGIDVKGLVRSAIKDALEDSDDFNEFMKMGNRVEDLEEDNEKILVKYDEMMRLVADSAVKIITLERDSQNLRAELAKRQWWKFWA